ncbi:hypothetical protein FEM48_Zijuj03G0165700 [Ziziphus jujuba var. spinosa]|uniref:Reticulon-like protein n=1 Tax=Ziziphus jujuba var. spinosa TaxID=714518 RepID=A0A978VRE8_ZIZJJ|nr:hypothetical protein FEM48_Zijuj03G0165700 [Ziziphus jujuba var. spinosa]
MAEHTGEKESLIEKITEKIHGRDSSSSSDSDDEKPSKVDSVQSKIFRLFGRERPVHKVLGGGKRTLSRFPFFFYFSLSLSIYFAELMCYCVLDVLWLFDVLTIRESVNWRLLFFTAADVFLWRNKKISGGVLGGATLLWILFELLEYHFITLICHVLILSLALLFLWSNASTFINKSPPHIPEVQLPEKCVLEVASALRIEFNQALAVLRDIASGRDLKKFLGVIAGLWVLSVVGNWCNFLTLFYIGFVLLHTVPVFYEKYEDHVDKFAEKATIEIKKQYAVFDAKVLSKIPKGPLKEKKKD